MFAGIGAFLAPYLTKIAVFVVVILIVTSGYFYWKHEVQAEQHKTDMKALAERNAKESEESTKIWNDAVQNIAVARQTDQENYNRTLQSYANIIVDSASKRVRNVAGVTTTKSNNCTASGQADISEGSTRADGRTSEEVPELAQLCLLAADQIRRTHNVR